MSDHIEKSVALNDLVKKLKSKRQFEEVKLPSRNLAYSDLGLEVDAPIHVRPMTISEEKILATSRLVKSGQAIDKIYEACIEEPINPDRFLSIDRSFLLFYIRGISYGPEYEVSLKCPSCDQSFNEVVNLDSLSIEFADDDFSDNIHVKLPDSGLNVWYRLPRGSDEKNLSNYKKHMSKGFGNERLDDSLIRRNILLINKIEQWTEKIEIEQIVNSLGVRDSNYLRDITMNPGIGLNTDISVGCPFCYHEWEVDLPVDASFFFPKTKKPS